MEFWEKTVALLQFLTMQRRHFLLVLLVLTLRGEAQTWKNFTSSLSVRCIANQDDTLWVGSNGGVTKYTIDGIKLANYTHADGLVDNYVSCVAIDSQGVKWFGSREKDYPQFGAGICKFDGVNWTTYNTSNSGLPSNNIFQICVDFQGNKWIATDKGLAKFNGINWTVYTKQNSGLPDNEISTLSIDKIGNLWLSGPYFVLVEFDGINWKGHPTTILGPVVTIAFDTANLPWLGIKNMFGPNAPNSQGGVIRYDGTSWYTYLQSNTGVSFEDGMIAFDKAGKLWSSSANGLAEFDGVNWHTHSSVGTDVLGNPGKYCLTIDKAGNKWFDVGWDNSYGNGLGKFDDSTWSVTNPSNSPLIDYYGRLLADHDGNVWVDRTSGRAAIRFNGASWTSIPNLHFDPYSNPPMAADYDNNIWFGDIAGNIYEYDGTNSNIIHQGNTAVYAIAVDKQNIKWFATERVYKYDGLNWTGYDISNSGIAANVANCIFVDSENNKWIGSYKGVSKFDGATWQVYNTSNSGIKSNSVLMVAEDNQHRKWFGTDKGVSVFDGTNWITYDTSNGTLSDNYIEGLAVDKENNVWISVGDRTPSAGVIKFDGINWTRYTMFNSGISGHGVGQIEVDKFDNKWFRTGAGYSVLTGSDTTFSLSLQFDESVCQAKTITLNPATRFGKEPFSYEWQSTGDSLSCYNCKNPVVTILQNEVFIVTVTDADGISISDTLNVYKCTNISDVKTPELAEDDFKVFPNPGNARVQLKFNAEKSGEYEILIQNLDGREVKYINDLGILRPGLYTKQIDICNLPDGFYLVGLKTYSGIRYKKLIKQGY